MFYFIGLLTLACRAPITMLVALLFQVLGVWRAGLCSALSWSSWIVVLVYVGGVLAVFAYLVVSSPDQPLRSRARGLPLAAAACLFFPVRVRQGVSVRVVAIVPGVMLGLAVYLLAVLVRVEARVSR